MESTITENAILVTLLAVVWFLFVKPIYKPRDGAEWRLIWVRTSIAIAVMYGLAWVMALAAKNLFHHAVLDVEALIMVGVIISALSLFAWLWQQVITSEKSVLNSAFEIGVSAVIAEMAVFDVMGELGGAGVRFLTFVVAMVLISKAINLAKSRWLGHLCESTRLKWRWVAACLVVTPFMVSSVTFVFLGASMPAILFVPLDILSDAPYLFEKYI